jgi:hypothetical protein
MAGSMGTQLHQSSRRNRGILAIEPRDEGMESHSGVLEESGFVGNQTLRAWNQTYPIYLSKDLYVKSNASLSLSELGLF